MFILKTKLEQQNRIEVKIFTPMRVAIKRMIPVIQARVVLTNITS